MAAFLFSISLCIIRIVPNHPAAQLLPIHHLINLAPKTGITLAEIFYYELKIFK
jgi:hypothetical protein